MTCYCKSAINFSKFSMLMAWAVCLWVNPEFNLSLRFSIKEMISYTYSKLILLLAPNSTRTSMIGWIKALGVDFSSNLVKIYLTLANFWDN